MEAVDKQFRIAREWSNRELRNIAPLFTGEIANVSAGENIDKQGSTYDEYFTNKQKFFLTNHNPGAFRGFEGRANEFLIDLSEDLPDEFIGRFDVVFNHTVLEHIFNIHKAFDNLCLLSKDIVIVIVPFAQMQHDSVGYTDYWRICPNGLRTLFQSNQLEVIYEACNENVNSANYLFFVGSRYPELWRSKMPPHQPITNAGSWIGYEPSKPPGQVELFKRRIKHLIKFIIPFQQN